MHYHLLATLHHPVIVRYRNTMQYPLLVALPSPVAVPYRIPIQIYGISSNGCIASSRGCFLFNSYSNMMQYSPLATLPHAVVVSC